MGGRALWTWTWRRARSRWAMGAARAACKPATPQLPAPCPAPCPLPPPHSLHAADQGATMACAPRSPTPRTARRPRRSRSTRCMTGAARKWRSLTSPRAPLWTPSWRATTVGARTAHTAPNRTHPATVNRIRSLPASSARCTCLAHTTQRPHARCNLRSLPAAPQAPSLRTGRCVAWRRPQRGAGSAGVHAAAPRGAQPRHLARLRTCAARNCSLPYARTHTCTHARMRAHADGYGQVAHHGGARGAARPARHHPQHL